MDNKMKKPLIYIFSAVLVAIFAFNLLSPKKILRVKFISSDIGLNLNKLPMLNDILSKKYKVVIAEQDYDLAIYSSREKPIEQNNSVKIYLSDRLDKSEIENYDLLIGSEYINSPKYMRIPLYYMYYGDKVSSDYNRGKCNPNKKNFACFLVSNSGEHDETLDGCVARNRMFHHLSLYKRVISGGKYLNNIRKIVTPEETIKWLSDCKFVIAYENQSYEGYMTEKPFQAYIAGAIPLYYAHPSALEDINKKAVIYRGDFEREEDMVEYIKKIDNDDKLYCEIWNQKMITDPKRNYKVIKAQLEQKLDELLESKLKK
jgi:hypothetical protein